MSYKVLLHLLSQTTPNSQINIQRKARYPLKHVWIKSRFYKVRRDVRHSLAEPTWLTNALILLTVLMVN